MWEEEMALLIKRTQTISKTRAEELNDKIFRGENPQPGYWSHTRGKGLMFWKSLEDIEKEPVEK
ncbi:hypothetical protein C2G38_2158253 [Gigaspora rosea]|uniref:Uncharacterized protein n=1 Tax=Gigaspora rosea TaxID=44941 RepID=A0A397W2L1_9GLOM|nr:hypothetical protein C2G38_2158253 [Gigaspora rosea]